jgi:8-amino-7-oxononanoate synthase
VAAALAALDVLEKEPERIDRLLRNAEKMRKGFRKLGFEVIDGHSAVVPVIVGDDMLAFQFWRGLFDAGVFVNAFISPGVPPGMQMMRTSYMATHEDEHLDRILEVFASVGKGLGIIS